MVARHTGPTLTDSFQRADRGASDTRIDALNLMLAPAGIRMNGDRPFDPRIRDERAVDQILRRGALGAGESYMRGWWDVPRLDECTCRLMQSGIHRSLRRFGTLKLLLRAWLSNPQAPSRAFRIGEAHYDRGNELFAAMLDHRMVYSCGYWEGAETLDAAQERKLDLICRKLGLKSGQRLLDIGCGWGSLVEFAARQYGVRAVGITVSRKQAEVARERCAGLPVEIRLQDYRDLDERFDHVASVGMIEHVGARNYTRLFDVVRRCLEADGLFLLHTIGSNISTRGVDPWIDRHIFPSGQLPSLKQLAAAIEERFVVEDLHNFGADYDRTLMAWELNFTRNWPDIAQRYDPTFFRMWRYYLLSCAGAFRARALQLWQLVLSPAGVPGGYRRPTID